MDLPEQLQQTLGDAYTIERELGGGGMSRVFVATERALGRQVVVKVLPSDMAGQVSVDRFKREIALAAQLQHPHIVPLLTAGASEGLPFFTMPYVKGESLRAQIARRGELPVTEAMRVLREVASALAFAHDAGVVHRDIKPDNVLLSGGSAMVTDFGVAKAVSASTTSGSSGLTSLGVALGTPAYMSPEQASADPMVDHRADIYSWGILAYELLTGSTPFSGRPAAAMLAAHTTEAAEPVARRRPGVPPALATLVMRCLEKRAADRPQDAGEIVRALDDMVTPSGGMTPANVARAPMRRRAMMAGIAMAVIGGLAFTGYGLMSRRRGASTAVRTIAVLPFENQNHDSTYNYLADGMSDELRSALNGIAGLSVKARSSSTQLRGKSAREAGGKLDVAVVLEGSLSRSGDRIHVTAELVSVADENTLWSGSFDRPATELPAVQDSIIRAVGNALKVRADAAGSTAAGAAGSRGTTNVAAYDFFLRGEYFRRRFDIPSAIPLLRQAVAADPSFARAHASLATAYATLPLVGATLGDSARQLAMQSVARAIALTPSSSAAYVAQAVLLIDDFHYAEAERVARKAVELDSTDADARTWHAFALGYMGRLDESLVESRRAVSLDPLSTDAQILVGATLMYTRRWPEFFASIRNVLAIDPKSSVALGNLSNGYALTGKGDSAGYYADVMLKIDGASYGVRAQAILAYLSAGRLKDAEEQRRLALLPGGNSPNYYRAVSGVLWGDFNAALDATERGVRAHEPLFNTIWLGCEPMFTPLRKQPRFVALIKETGGTICSPDDQWSLPRPPGR